MPTKTKTCFSLRRTVVVDGKRVRSKSRSDYFKKKKKDSNPKNSSSSSSTKKKTGRPRKTPIQQNIAEASSSSSTTKFEFEPAEIQNDEALAPIITTSQENLKKCTKKPNQPHKNSPSGFGEKFAISPSNTPTPTESSPLFEFRDLDPEGSDAAIQQSEALEQDLIKNADLKSNLGSIQKEHHLEQQQDLFSFENCSMLKLLNPDSDDIPCMLEGTSLLDSPESCGSPEKGPKSKSPPKVSKLCQEINMKYQSDVKDADNSYLDFFFNDPKEGSDDN